MSKRYFVHEGFLQKRVGSGFLVLDTETLYTTWGKEEANCIAECYTAQDAERVALALNILHTIEKEMPKHRVKDEES